MGSSATAREIAISPRQRYLQVTISFCTVRKAVVHFTHVQLATFGASLVSACHTSTRNKPQLPSARKKLECSRCYRLSESCEISRSCGATQSGRDPRTPPRLNSVQRTPLRPKRGLFNGRRRCNRKAARDPLNETHSAQVLCEPGESGLISHVKLDQMRATYSSVPPLLWLIGNVWRPALLPLAFMKHRRSVFLRVQRVFYKLAACSGYFCESGRKEPCPPGTFLGNYGESSRESCAPCKVTAMFFLTAKCRRLTTWLSPPMA